MTYRLFSILVSIFLAVGFFSCGSSKAGRDDKPLVKINGKKFYKSDYDIFVKAVKLYPAAPDNSFFPGRRDQMQTFIESMLLFKEAEKSVGADLKKSLDWEWKERFYKAQPYFIDILVSNWGYSDDEISKYYDEHSTLYQSKITVKGADSTSRDSLVQKPLAEVKSDIIKEMFFEDYAKTDPKFNQYMAKNSNNEELSKKEWLLYVKKDLGSFFLKKYFKEIYGNDYYSSDSLDKVYGKGKIISDDDFNVIVSWLPNLTRKNYDDKKGKRHLVEWLLKWKLFEQVADKTGYNSKPKSKKLLKMAWKYSVVLKYVNDYLASELRGNIPVDTSMILYKRWDFIGRPSVVGPSKMAELVVKEQKERVATKIKEKIYGLVASSSIEFLSEDSEVPSFITDPEKYLAKADTLYSSGKLKEAEKIYRDISSMFIFTEYGVKATVNLAKVQADQGSYSSAVRNYRKALLNSTNKKEFPNIFFMIGYIYSENLHNPELAEVNYKWILKNAPNSDLADDAEFMCQHIGDPMSDIDELQLETKRQGVSQ